MLTLLALLTLAQPAAAETPALSGTARTSWSPMGLFSPFDRPETAWNSRMSVVTRARTVAGREGASCGQGGVFQRTAVLALGGKWGKLQPWQEWWYKHGLKHGITAKGWAGMTAYGPWDPPGIYGGDWYWFRGDHSLHEGICAANREIPKGSIVWTDWGLRLVGDRGGAVCLGRVRRATAEFDYFIRNATRAQKNREGLTRYVVLRWGWDTGSPSPPLDVKPAKR